MPIAIERNQEYERAEYAYKCIEDVLHTHLAIKDKYRSEVLQTAARINACGLLQTLTFYCLKMKEENGKKNHFIVLNLHLMKWILRDEVTTTWNEDEKQTFDLFKEKILANPANKMLYTERAMSIIVWMKRFTEGMIEKKD